MQITDVKVKKVNSEGKMKAIASITIDDAFAIHDIKVIESPTRTFIAMPSRRTPKGDWTDIAHPINQDTRDMIVKVILDEYEKVLKEASEAPAETAE